MGAIVPFNTYNVCIVWAISISWALFFDYQSALGQSDSIRLSFAFPLGSWEPEAVVVYFNPFV